MGKAGMVILPWLEQPLADVSFLISQLGYLWRQTPASVPLTTLHSQQEGLHILESIGTSPGKYCDKSSVGQGQVPRVFTG